MFIRPLRAQIILLSDIWCASTGVSRARLSTRLFSSGAQIDRIAAGADITTATYERALRWLSDRWPDGAVWPADVPRPPPAPDSPDNAAPQT